MSIWGDLITDLDATVFAELSDDPAATWSRDPLFSVVVGALLDGLGRDGAARHPRAPRPRPGPAGIPFDDRGDAVRISVAEADARRPGDTPQSGDRFIIAGVSFVVHGTPWRDEAHNSRDWLSPVTR